MCRGAIMKKLILALCIAQTVFAGSGTKLFVLGSRAHSCLEQVRDTFFTHFLSQHLREAILTKGEYSYAGKKADITDKISALLVMSLEYPDQTLLAHAQQKFMQGTPTIYDYMIMERRFWQGLAITNLHASLEKNMKESSLLKSIQQDIEDIAKAYRWNKQKTQVEIQYVYDRIIQFLQEARQTYAAVTVDQINGGKQKLNQCGQKLEPLKAELARLTVISEKQHQEYQELQKQYEELAAQLGAQEQKMYEKLAAESLELPLYRKIMRSIKKIFA